MTGPPVQAIKVQVEVKEIFLRVIFAVTGEKYSA